MKWFVVKFEWNFWLHAVSCIYQGRNMEPGVKHFLPNFRNIMYWVAELDAKLWFVTKSKELKILNILIVWVEIEPKTVTFTVTRLCNFATTASYFKFIFHKNNWWKFLNETYDAELRKQIYTWLHIHLCDHTPTHVTTDFMWWLHHIPVWLHI